MLRLRALIYAEVNHANVIGTNSAPLISLHLRLPQITMDLPSGSNGAIARRPHHPICRALPSARTTTPLTVTATTKASPPRAQTLCNARRTLAAAFHHNAQPTFITSTAGCPSTEMIVGSPTETHAVSTTWSAVLSASTISALATRLSSTYPLPPRQ